jgi:predicted DNA binding CopG/RHH family protein
MGYEWDADEMGWNWMKTFDFSKGKRGPVVKPSEGKEKITIRIDKDVLDWFRDQVDAAGGGNYQTLINAALREHIGGKSPTLERMLRRVVREELKLLHAG